jgi:uncharacterized membrane protein YeaQ/YmgE (transglycosylase-associated protein family)
MPLIFYVIVIGCGVGFAARFAVASLVWSLQLKEIRPPSPLITAVLGIAGVLLAQLVVRGLGLLPPPHVASLVGMTLGAIIMMSLWYLVTAVLRG